MAQKAFMKIKEAELQAQSNIKNAQEEAAQIIARAEKETADSFAQHSELCKRQAQEKKQQEEADAQSNSGDFSKETAENCAALKEKLSLQKPKAVNAVIEMITT